MSCPKSTLKMRRWRRNNPSKRMLASARMRARASNIKFTITLKDIEPLPSHCPVFGIKLLLEGGTRKQRSESPTIDRIINSKGYVPGNVVVISWWANRLKSDATIEELEKIINFYKTLEETS